MTDTLTASEREHRALKRAATLVQNLYLQFRENTWTLTLAFVTNRNGNVIVHPGAGTGVKKGPFSKFPDNLKISESTKAAVLTLNTCNEAFVLMEKLFMRLMQGYKDDLSYKEVSVIPTKPMLITSYWDETKPIPKVPNWPGRHYVLRVDSLKLQTSWYIDITGAQYGRHEAFYEVKDYEQYVEEGSAKEHDLGWMKVNIAKVVPHNEAYDQRKLAADNLNTAVGLWVDSHMKLSDFVDLEDSEFNRYEGSLQSHLDEAVKTYVSELGS